MTTELTQTDAGAPVRSEALLASLAAIHWHSGKFSVRHWRLVPKRHLAATLKAIHDEAARHMPDAIKQIEANKS
jgi:hypothetical protein